MPTIIRFEDIEAWQTARELTRAVYRLSQNEMFSRDFGLRDQMRRAAVSVMSNIAEGFESRTQGLFKDYLGRAKASSGELRSQSYIAKDVGYLSEDEFKQLFDLCDKCSRQIFRFMQYLANQPKIIREDDNEYNV